MEIFSPYTKKESPYSKKPDPYQQGYSLNVLLLEDGTFLFLETGLKISL